MRTCTLRAPHRDRDRWPLVLIATLGVVIGTALGTKVLGHLPAQVFRRVLAIVLLVLGLYMAVTGGR